jgi:hypothetical protein
MLADFGVAEGVDVSDEAWSFVARGLSKLSGRG